MLVTIHTQEWGIMPSCKDILAGRPGLPTQAICHVPCQCSPTSKFVTCVWQAEKHSGIPLKREVLQGATALSNPIPIIGCQHTPTAKEPTAAQPSNTNKNQRCGGAGRSSEEVHLINLPQVITGANLLVEGLRGVLSARLSRSFASFDVAFIIQDRVAL